MQLVYITAPDQASAEALARQLLEQRLIACANIFPITSIYREKEIVTTQEVVVLVKTTDAVQLEPAVAKLHLYKTPCILQIPATANAAYDAWLRQHVQDPSN